MAAVGQLSTAILTVASSSPGGLIASALFVSSFILNDFGARAGHVPQPMHFGSSILICIFFRRCHPESTEGVGDLS
jgi:hypothetical protein